MTPMELIIQLLGTLVMLGIVNAGLFIMLLYKLSTFSYLQRDLLEKMHAVSQNQAGVLEIDEDD